MMSMDELQVKDEYFDLIPRPSKEDRYTLKQSIMSDGQQMPIVVNEQGIILDGHTRYEICLELDIIPKVAVQKFENEEQERKFIILSNIARRHLTQFQKIELAWEIYENEKARAKLRADWRKYGKEPPTKEGNAMTLFAKYMNTGHSVIHEVEWLKKNASEAMLEKLRTGDVTIRKAYDLLRGAFLIPHGNMKKPQERPKSCPKCEYDVVNKQERKCHVHRWYCCSNCKWGI